QWEKKDPIDRYEKLLTAERIMAAGEIGELEKRIEQELDTAQAWAEAVPPPDPATLTKGVYAED
ncbi:MAG TPA: thiamine pyrophosphate-dependent dehydrogenase E1 component subunit alpha, partial [Candidatus Polarisedimenticolia bacterium]|nr:thiamine pyrophosphate-dependent dehydrogenase E1 component subunit alpha [Candidatus Polarisedimenticolia bacterium]